MVLFSLHGGLFRPGAERIRVSTFSHIMLLMRGMLPVPVGHSPREGMRCFS